MRVLMMRLHYLPMLGLRTLMFYYFLKSVMRSPKITVSTTTPSVIFPAFTLFFSRNAGCLQLGSNTASTWKRSISTRAHYTWATVLKGKDLLLYGCQVAKGQWAICFLQQLRQLTGANIAALYKASGSSKQRRSPFNRRSPQAGHSILKLGNLSTPLAFSNELRLHIQATSSLLLNFSVSTDTLIESEGTPFSFIFELSEAPPAEGTKIRFESTTPQAINQWDLFSLTTTGLADQPVDISPNQDFSAFELTIVEQRATIDVPVFNDFINEGPDPYTWTVSAISGGTVGTDTAQVTIYDDASQVPITPDPIEPPTLTLPEVSITSDITTLVENEGSEVTFTLTLSEAPTGPLLIDLATGKPFALGDFDIFPPPPQASATGGQLVGGNSDNSGFTFAMTSQTATIKLPIFNDQDRTENGALTDPNGPLRNDDIGVEQTTFTVLPGEGYTVSSSASDVTLTLADTQEQLNPTPQPTTPIVSFSTTPEVISEAEGNALVMNFSVEGDIPEGGITVNLEGDVAEILQQFLAPDGDGAVQTRVTPEGNILYRFDTSFEADNDNFGNVVGGILEVFALEDGDPAEDNSNPAVAGTGFLSNFSFTITEPTASITLPVFDDLIQEPDQTFTYTLADGAGYIVNPEASSGTFTVTDGVPGGVGPTVGVTATPTTLIEAEQTVLELTFTTEGEIPPEGLVVQLAGPPRAIAEFDVNATNPRLPEAETVVEGVSVTGGNIVGTDEVAGSLFLRITDPTATVTVPVFQDDVAEGTEVLPFTLLDGELYEVDPAASQVTLTIEDGVAPPTPQPTTPIVSFSTTPEVISEAEGNALVMNFSVEGDIPEGGITVNLEGDVAEILQQFLAPDGDGAVQTRVDSRGQHPLSI